MITSALLGLALIAPADTDIEPIEESMIELLVVTEEGQELCRQIGEVSTLIDGLAVRSNDPELGDVLHAMATTFYAAHFENGFDESAAMTLEAEEAFAVWVDGCQ